AEILGLDAVRPDVLRLPIGGGLPVKADGTVQLPATVRLTCVIDGTSCRLGTVNLSENVVIPLVARDRPYAFIVEDMEADLPSAAREAEIAVRFVARAETAALLRVGDVDRRVIAGRDHSRRFARIESIGPRHQ